MANDTTVLDEKLKVELGTLRGAVKGLQNRYWVTLQRRNARRVSFVDASAELADCHRQLAVLVPLYRALRGYCNSRVNKVSARRGCELYMARHAALKALLTRRFRVSCGVLREDDMRRRFPALWELPLPVPGVWGSSSAPIQALGLTFGALVAEAYAAAVAEMTEEQRLTRARDLAYRELVKSLTPEQVALARSCCGNYFGGVMLRLRDLPAADVYGGAA